MSAPIDGTHDAALKSWVDSANTAETDFPIQNLPLGVFGRGEKPRREHERLVVVGPLVDGSRAQERAQLLAEVLALAVLAAWGILFG